MALPPHAATTPPASTISRHRCSQFILFPRSIPRARASAGVAALVACRSVSRPERGVSAPLGASTSHLRLWRIAHRTSRPAPRVAGNVESVLPRCLPDVTVPSACLRRLAHIVYSMAVEDVLTRCLQDIIRTVRAAATTPSLRSSAVIEDMLIGCLRGILRSAHPAAPTCVARALGGRRGCARGLPGHPPDHPRAAPPHSPRASGAGAEAGDESAAASSIGTATLSHREPLIIDRISVAAGCEPSLLEHEQLFVSPTEDDPPGGTVTA